MDKYVWNPQQQRLTLNPEWIKQHTPKNGRTKREVDPLKDRLSNHREVVSVLALTEALKPIFFEYLQQKRSPIMALAEDIGVDSARVRSVLLDQQYVTMPVVDNWLSALGLTHWLHDGTLRIVANPYYRPERCDSE